MPLHTFINEDAEYLSFPMIFLGKRRPTKCQCHVNVHSVDKRAATNIPNLFFKLKKLEMKQVHDNFTLAIHRCKTKGKKLCKVKSIPDNTKR